ncbi:MAG: Branched-chain amino acid transporter, amino acid-binding protein [Myxococcaceae bacterium]|nr:Branched-chain amino acid transporter, amino acid-binding protein [Myxococcaceae bacterium]
MVTSRILRRFVVPALLLGTAGCSLLLSVASPDQCKTDADCEASPALRTLVCKEGICTKRETSSVPVAVDGGAPCTSTDICSTQNSGNPVVCRSPKCVALTNPACNKVIGEWKDPNALFVGVMGLLTTRQLDRSVVPSAAGKEIFQSIELAYEEVTSSLAAGILPGTGRPLVLVECDTANDYRRQAKEDFAHLVDVVGVKTVIVASDADVAAIAPEAAAKNVAIVCASCIGAPLAGEPSSLVWRVLSPLADQARLTAFLVGMTEKGIHQTTPGSTLRVAMLQQEAVQAQDYVDALLSTGSRPESELKFNGMSYAAQNANFHLTKTPDPTRGFVDHAAVAQEIVDFHPDIILVAVSDDFQKFYVPLIESQWTATWGTTYPKPYYLATTFSFTPGLYYSLIHGGGKNNVDLERRIIGTNYKYDEKAPLNAAFAAHYQAKWGNAPDFAGGAGYDAMWATTYALLVANRLAFETRSTSAFDGAQVSLGFQKLVSGPLISVGRDDFPTGSDRVNANQSINLEGVKSNFDWDLTTHTIHAPLATHCLRGPANAFVVDSNAGPTCPADPKQPCTEGAGGDAGAGDAGTSDAGGDAGVPGRWALCP